MNKVWLCIPKRDFGFHPHLTGWDAVCVHAGDEGQRHAVDHSVSQANVRQAAGNGQVATVLLAYGCDIFVGKKKIQTIF